MWGAEQEAHLQAVPLWRISLKHMGRALKHYRGRFNTIVAFRPTGWAHQTGRPCPDNDEAALNHWLSMHDLH